MNPGQKRSKVKRGGRKTEDTGFKKSTNPKNKKKCGAGENEEREKRWKGTTKTRHELQNMGQKRAGLGQKKLVGKQGINSGNPK